MKIKYLVKNIGRVSLVTGLLAMTSLSSCLKDKSPGTIDFSKSPALIEWQYAGFTATPYTAPVLQQAGFVFNLEVALSVHSVTLGSAVSASVVEDKSLLPAGTVELPADQYVLGGGGKVTINPGQQLVKFPITFAGDKIDFSQPYALALKLASPSGVQLTTNLNVAIVNIKLKSLFDDTYNVVSGQTTTYTGAVADPAKQVSVFPVTETTIALHTVSADEVAGQSGSSAFALTAAYKIDGTTVTPLADPGNPGSTFNYVDGSLKGAHSSYDPATKTLTLHYHYLNGSGNVREVDEVLVGQ